MEPTNVNSVCMCVVDFTLNSLKYDQRDDERKNTAGRKGFYVMHNRVCYNEEHSLHFKEQ
jgi:hypothetical protein